MKGGKFLKTFLSIVLIVFFVYQIIVAFNNPFTTISASYYETFKGIDANAVIIRDETVLYDNSTGVKSFTVENGERVAKNGVLANVFYNEEVANVYSQIKELQIKLVSQ